MDDATSPHQSRQTRIDLAIARVAERYGGHITRAELTALGLSRSAIDHRIARGLLLPVYRGVYAVGHLPTNHVDRARAALLACGARSALGYGSAGAYWDIYKRWTYPLEVVVAANRRSAGIRIHHSGTLTRADVWTPEPNLRVTSPARTLLDLTPRLHEKRLTWLLSNLRVRRLVTVEQLASVAARNPTHPGRKRLQRLIGASPEEPFRSPFEVDWPPFADRHGLGEYEMNVFVGGYRVDVVFLPARLVVWLDGWDTHGLKSAFEEDRAAVNELLAERGIPSIRITYEQFHAHPDRCARCIAKTLARQPL